MSSSLNPGAKLGRYEIVSQIGAGGMGQVYLAEDTSLHRKIALKVLPAEVASNRDRMRRFKHAKILDFGLAKLVEGASANSPGNSDDEAPTMMQQSTPGLILGTTGYMSPEQAQGRTNEIDRRSDIFSFGCILFEAVTCHKAFAGADAVDSLNRIIREPAPLISSFNPNAPADLQRIVRRCLAKDPDDRYQSIKDIALELKEIRSELQQSLARGSSGSPTLIDDNETSWNGSHTFLSRTRI